MTNLKRLTVITLCLAACSRLSAQSTGDAATDTVPQYWDLQTCIDYAKEHNITIRRNRINAESTEEDVKTAKAEWLPSLNGSLSQRVVNRPNSNMGTIISGDNITTSQSKTSYNGSYGIDASWTLFNGGSRINTIKQQKLNNRMAQLAVTESENSIQENIIQLYMQILYADEAVKVNRSTLEVSRAECERAKQLYDAGSLSIADVAQLEAQVSNDNYQVVASEATLQDYKLQLKQLLELDGMYEMSLDIPPTGQQRRAHPPAPERRHIPRRTGPAPRNRVGQAEHRSRRPRHQGGTVGLHSLHQPDGRHRQQQRQRQRLHLLGANQAELEQLAGRHAEHTALRPPANQKPGEQSQAAKANQPTGPAGPTERTVPHHRKLLAGRLQRTEAIRSRRAAGKQHADQLQPGERTVQPGHEEHRGTAHRKEQPAQRPAATVAGQIHGHPQHAAATLLPGAIRRTVNNQSKKH